MLHFKANISCSVSACKQFPECSLCFQGFGVGEWSDGRIWLALQSHQSERCLLQDGQGFWTRLKPGSVVMSGLLSPAAESWWFPMRGTQSYVPMTFFFALKLAAVFIAQEGWGCLYKENITTSSVGFVCVALIKFIPHIKITTWILKPPHFYDGIKKPDLWVCFFCPHCPLLNSSTIWFHHHYFSNKHQSVTENISYKQ